MPSQQELNFLIKARDEASAEFKKLQSTIGGVGESASASLEKIAGFTEAITQAAEAAAGIFSSFELARKAVENFGELQAGMLNIARASGIAREGVAGFTEEFEKLGQSSGGKATEGQLISIVEASAKVGVAKGDLLEFAQVILNLGLNAQGAGAQYAQAIGQILDITENGTASAKEYGDEVAYLSEKTGTATDALVLHARALASATAGYNVTKEEVNALAVLFDGVPGRFNGAANAVATIFSSMNRDTDATRRGFDELSKSSGRTVAELQNLRKTDPSAVFALILQHVKELNAQHLAPDNFLQRFSIEAGEANRILGQLADKSEKYNSAIKLQQQPEVAGSAQKRGDEDSKTLNEAVNKLSTAFDSLFTLIGSKIGPAVYSVLDGISTGINKAVEAFDSLNEPTKELLAWAVTIIPAIAGVIAVIGTFGKIGGAVFDAMKIGAKSLAFEIGAITGAVVLWGVALYKVVGFWNEVQSLHDKGISYTDIARGANPFSDTATVQAALKPKYGNLVNDADSDRELKTQKARSTLTSENGPTSTKEGTARGGTTGTDGLTEQEIALLGQIDPLKALNLEITKYNELIQKAAGLPAGATGALTQEDTARVNENLKIKERALDPVQEQIRQAGIALNLQSQTNASAREQVEITNALNAAQEKDGNFQNRPDQQQAVAQGVRDKDSTASNQKLNDQNRSLDIQIAKQLAIGDAAKNQIDVEQKINDFLKDNAGASDTLLASYRARLEVSNQIAQTEAVISKYLPQVSALKSYDEQLQAINNSLTTQGEKQQAIQVLNAQTLAARDPLGSLVQSGQRELDTVKLIGPYRDADAKTLQQINDLKDKGTNLTTEESSKLQQLNRDMADLSKSQTTGFNGFVNSVGSVNDQIGKLTGTFSSSLSDGIVSALSGNRNAFVAAGQALGKAAIKSGTDLILSEIFKSTGLAGLDTTKANKVQTDLDQFKKLAAGQVNMTAQNVYVNGQLEKAAAVAAGSNQNSPTSAPTGLAPGTNTTPDYQRTIDTAAATKDLHLGAGAGTGSFGFSGVGGASKPAVSISGDSTVQAGGPVLQADGSFKWPDSTKSPGSANANSPYGGLPGPSAFGGSTGGGQPFAGAASPFASAPGANTPGAGVSPNIAGLPNYNPKDPKVISQYEDAAHQYLISKGYSPNEAATIMGNIKQESTFNPNSVNKNDAGPGKDSVGIVQDNRQRLAGLNNQYQQEFGTTQGLTDQQKYQAQLDDVHNQIQHNSDYSTSLKQNAPSLNAGQFGHTFEGFGDNSAGTRSQNASYYASRYGSGNQSVAPTAQKQIDYAPTGSITAAPQAVAGANDALRRGTGDGYSSQKLNASDSAILSNQNYKSAQEAIDATHKLSPEGMDNLQQQIVDSHKFDNIDTDKLNQVYAQFTGDKRGPAFDPYDPAHDAQDAQLKSETKQVDYGDSQSQINSASKAIQDVNIHSVAGSPIPQAQGAAVTSASVAAQGKTPSLGIPGLSLGGGLGDTSGVGGQVAGGAAGLTTQALSNIPGLGPLGGLGLSLLKPLLTSAFSVLHDGGKVGSTNAPIRLLSAGTIAMARRYHDGLGDDEFPAVLQKGERVLTASQDSRNSAAMSRLADSVANQSTSAGTQAVSQRPANNNNVSMVIHSPNASSFRSSQSQIGAQMHASISRAGAKHN